MFDNFFDGCLSKNGIDLVIDNGTHETGIDIEILYMLDLDAIMFIYFICCFTCMDISITISIFAIIMHNLFSLGCI